MRTFKLTERDLQSSCRQIEVEGELDLAVADQLQEAIDRAASQRQVLIDLERCEFIDSTVIAVIVQAYRQLGEKGRRLSICAPTDQVLRILSITGLTVNGLVFESAEQAVASSSATPLS